MNEQDIRTGAQLQTQFPYMFAGDNIGFAFYRGWMPIVVGVCFDLDTLLTDQREAFHWTQIKEKFGTLRLYYDFGTHRPLTMDFRSPNSIQSVRVQAVEPLSLEQVVDDLVVHAQNASAIACMVCGARARTKVYDNYLLTVCEIHHPDRVRKMDEYRHEGVWRLARSRNDEDDD